MKLKIECFQKMDGWWFKVFVGPTEVDAGGPSSSQAIAQEMARRSLKDWFRTAFRTIEMTNPES